MPVRIGEVNNSVSLRALLFALVLACPAAGSAHDSWLSVASGAADDRLLQLELGVGPRYPQRESAPAPSSVERAGCRVAGAATDQPLLPRQAQERFLELRARIDGSRGAACWAELKAHEAQMTPELVKVYFLEIRPPAAHAQRWAAQHARGVAWRESYRKFARIELPPPENAPRGTLAALREPRGLPMEIIPVGDEPIQVAKAATFQVLLDGQPLAQQWVEFVSSKHTLGVWRQTDGQGQVSLALPFAGNWLLRSTRLEPPDEDAQPWRSRFSTLMIQAR